MVTIDANAYVIDPTPDAQTEIMMVLARAHEKRDLPVRAGPDEVRRVVSLTGTGRALLFCYIRPGNDSQAEEAMTDVLVYAVVAAVAAGFGAIAGRVLAVEAESRLTAIFAGTYVGAGVGLLSAMPMGSLLALVAQFLNAESTWFDALDVAGMSLVWGTASGAAGGLAVSIVIAALNLRRLKQT